MAQQRDMRGENGLLSKWVRANKHHRTTTVFQISISNKDRSRSRSSGAADSEESWWEQEAPAADEALH